MSFDIARTPTLHAVATGDEQQLVEDLQERVEAAIRQAAETPAVVEAAEAQRRAELHFLSPVSYTHLTLPTNREV